MIEYINERQLEQRYARWRRGRKADPSRVEVRVQTRVESASRVIARRLVAGESVTRFIGGMLKDAKEEALWSEFRDEVTIGPAQQQGMIYAVTPEAPNDRTHAQNPPE